MCTNGIVAPLILLSVLFVPACGHTSPTAPSPPAGPSPVPVPTASTDVWNITVRVATVSGNDCVGDTMQSQVGVPKSYSLSTVTTSSGVDVRLKSASGDYDCTFPAKPESDGFTTFGVGGWYSCTTSLAVPDFVCANGAERNIVRFGQNISGRVSGDEISGRWDVEWDVMEPGNRNIMASVETTAQYTGTR